MNNDKIPQIEKETTRKDAYPFSPGNGWVRQSVVLGYEGRSFEGKIIYIHDFASSDWHINIESYGSGWRAYAWSGDVDENETIAKGEFVEVTNTALEAMATGAVPHHTVDGTIIGYDSRITYESVLETLDNTVGPITDSSESLDPDDWGTGDPRMLLKDRSVIEVFPRNHNSGRILVRSPSREDGSHYMVPSMKGLDSVLDDLGFPAGSY